MKNDKIVIIGHCQREVCMIDGNSMIEGNDTFCHRSDLQNLSDSYVCVRQGNFSPEEIRVFTGKFNFLYRLKALKNGTISNKLVTKIRGGYFGYFNSFIVCFNSSILLWVYTLSPIFPDLCPIIKSIHV